MCRHQPHRFLQLAGIDVLHTPATHSHLPFPALRSRRYCKCPVRTRVYVGVSSPPSALSPLVTSTSGHDHARLRVAGGAPLSIFAISDASKETQPSTHTTSRPTSTSLPCIALRIESEVAPASSRLILAAEIDDIGFSSLLARRWQL